MSQFLAIVSAIREIYKIVKVFLDMIEKKRVADALKRRQRLREAVNDLSNAQSDEEKKDAQRRIVDNSN